MNDDYKVLIEVLQGNEVTEKFIEKMEEWIGRHRIEKIVYNQMKNKNSSYGVKISNALNNMQERRNNYINFLCELNSEYSKYEPIFIKGVTAYLLTNDENLIKKSSDIDLFGYDLFGLQEKLISGGFEIFDTSCDRHEFSKLHNSKKEIYIEIHEYFPLLYLDENCVERYTSLNTTKIEYLDLWKESKIINWYGRKIRVLNPEMAVLISCAHVFKGYVWEPYMKHMFRAQELLEIYSIINNTNFNIQKFVDLCTKYNGWHASSFCKELLGVIYGENNPLKFVEKVFPPIFKLTNDIGGVFKRYQGEDYFSKVLTNCALDFIDTEMINIISARNYNINQLEFIDCGKNKANGNIDFSVSISKRKINFRFFVRQPFSNGDNILIQLNKVHFHFHMDKNKSKCKTFGVAKCDFHEVENGYWIHCVGVSNEEINIEEEKGVIIYENKGNSYQLLIPIKLSENEIVE